MENKKVLCYNTNILCKWQSALRTLLFNCLCRFTCQSKTNARLRHFFLTGSDEHGQKIERNAAKAGKTPKEFVDNIVNGIKDLWKLMDISYDKFIRTTDSDHKLVVQKIFKTLFDNGDIYKSSYEGLYCVPCESFFTEAQLKEGKCPDCGRDVELTKEESYFFKASKYQKQLEKLFIDNPNFLVPESRKNEMFNSFIKGGVEDVCVTRTSFKWGVPVDFDPAHVVYVWIDALIILQLLATENLMTHYLKSFGQQKFKL